MVEQEHDIETDDTEGHSTLGSPRPGGPADRPGRRVPAVDDDEDDTAGHLMVRTDESISSTGADADRPRH